MQKIIKKIINQNLISYKTVIRGYSKTNEDNKEILIRQKEIIITEVKTTQKMFFYLIKLMDVLLVTLENLLLRITTALSVLLCLNI